MHEQIVSILYSRYLYVVFLIPTVLYCTYNNQNQAEESQPLLITIDQAHTLNTTSPPCTEKILKALLPLEIWHTIMDYLEGDNNFLNTVLARIFIPTERIRKNILASFNSYLTRVSPEQRIKALRKFYTTVRYTPEHNILGRTASVTQPLMQAVICYDFNAARTLVPELSSLPTKHALYVINYCRRFTENHKIHKHTGKRPVCYNCLCILVGALFIIAGVFDFARIKQFTNEYKKPTIISSIALLYTLCYSFIYYRNLSCFNTLEQFLEVLGKQVQLITSPKTMSS